MSDEKTDLPASRKPRPSAELPPSVLSFIEGCNTLSIARLRGGGTPRARCRLR
jgi:hypothetical protein